MSRPDEATNADAISERKPPADRPAVRAEPRRVRPLTAPPVSGGVLALRIVWAAHVVCYLLALGVAVFELRTIVVSGPLLSLLGLVVAGVSLAASYRLGVVAALTTPALCLFLFLLIAGLQLNVPQSQAPVYLFGSAYAVALVGFLVLVLLWRGRRGFVGVRIDLPSRLHAAAQEEAWAQGVTLEQLVVAALADRVLPAEVELAEPGDERRRYRGSSERVAEREPG